MIKKAKIITREEAEKILSKNAGTTVQLPKPAPAAVPEPEPVHKPEPAPEPVKVQENKPAVQQRVIKKPLNLNNITDSTVSDSTEKSEPACIAYEHYQSIFDEIYLSVEKYERTPNRQLRRQVTNFTELYRRGAVTDGMRFTMKYDGEIYYAKAVLWENECFFTVLDENEQFYTDKDGNIIGAYDTSSSAGVDAINLRREKKGIPEKVKTLRGTTYWVNDEGMSIKDLIDKY